jgi:hypothetical protein
MIRRRFLNPVCVPGALLRASFGFSEVLAVLRRHEDVSRFIDVRQTLQYAGISIGDEPVSLPSPMSLAAVIRDAATCSDGGTLSSQNTNSLIVLWHQCLAVYVPRNAHHPVDLVEVLEALSVIIHGSSNTALPTPWMHLLVVRILRLALLATAGEDAQRVKLVDTHVAWISVLQRQQELWARMNVDSSTIDGSARTAVMLHQYSFFRASGSKIQDTEIGRLLSNEPRSPTFGRRITMDPRVTACWNQMKPWVEVGLSALAQSGGSVWANNGKDGLANAPMEDVLAINRQLSGIGRGSSASTVV